MTLSELLEQVESEPFTETEIHNADYRGQALPTHLRRHAKHKNEEARDEQGK